MIIFRTFISCHLLEVWGGGAKTDGGAWAKHYRVVNGNRHCLQGEYKLEDDIIIIIFTGRIFGILLV